MPTPRAFLAVAVCQNKIYCIGGLSGFSTISGELEQITGVNEVYDPVTDTWTTKSPIPIPKTKLQANVVNGKIYLLGGNANATLNQVYDTESDSWTLGAGKPTDRIDFGVAVVNDKLYVIGDIVRRYPITFGWGLYDDTPTAVNEQYTPIGYGTPDPSYNGAAPEITVTSPENKTYYTTDIALNFTVDEPVSLMQYKLDGETFEISGNTTLTGLSYGLHNLTVHATSAADNTGSSEIITFTVAEKPEPSPTTLVAVASAVSASVVGLGFLFYFKRSRTKNNRAEKVS
jgi:hypothetical protein